MARLSITIPDEAWDALNEMSKSTGRPLALIVREALEGYLTAQGIEVSTKVEWGGKRKRPDKEEK